jgi:hypothetical protein
VRSTRLVASLAVGAWLCIGMAGCARGEARLVDVCPAALIEGTLVADLDGGIHLSSGGLDTPLAWPSGYFLQAGDGSIDVRDKDGNVVAHAGDAIRLRGGLDEQGRWQICGEPPEGR